MLGALVWTESQKNILRDAHIEGSLSKSLTFEL